MFSLSEFSISISFSSLLSLSVSNFLWAQSSNLDLEGLSSVYNRFQMACQQNNKIKDDKTKLGHEEEHCNLRLPLSDELSILS